MYEIKALFTCKHSNIININTYINSNIINTNTYINSLIINTNTIHSNEINMNTCIASNIINTNTYIKCSLDSFSLSIEDNTKCKFVRVFTGLHTA